MAVRSGKPQTIPSKDLKAFLNANKRESRLLGAIERHRLAQPFDERAQDVLHPSDLIKPEWCALAAYHALQGNYVETRDKTTLRLQSIFDEGHYIHDKWQNYFRDMGNLFGDWRCKACKSIVVNSLPPKSCPSCERIDFIEYNEVPLFSEKHRIRGHADGWIKGIGDDCLIEIKSIGTGTLRMEAPALMEQYGGDIDMVWKNLRQPLRPHLLQGQVYLHLAHLMKEAGYFKNSPDEIVFLYELKANQEYKEYVVKYNPEFTEDIFEKALDVSWAAENNRPPLCSIDSEKGCKRCEPFREDVA